MGKTLQLTRSELIWQTRCNSWDENDYKKYLEWLKGFEGKEDGWAKNNYATYKFLSAYTWDEILAYFDRNDEDKPRIQFIDKDGQIEYSQSLTEIIREAMREDNYSCEVCGEEYADDYEEDWNIALDSEETIDEQ